MAKLIDSKLHRSSSKFRQYTATTTDICKIQPVFAREVIPGDKWNINHSQINRFAPLAVPAFTALKNRNTWYRVDYSQVWSLWNRFYSMSFATDKSTQDFVLSSCPHTDINFFARACAMSACNSTNNKEFPCASDWVLATSCTYDSANGKFDYEPDGCVTYYATKAVPVYYRLTSKGRYIYNILVSLGYNVPLSISYDPDNTDNQFIYELTSSVNCSFLPLYCYLNILSNYYVPSKFRINAQKVVDQLYYNFTLIGIQGPYFSMEAIKSSYTIIWNYIFDLLSSVYYGEDYFTSSLIGPLYHKSSYPYTPINIDDVSLQTFGNDLSNNTNKINVTPIDSSYSEGDVVPSVVPDSSNTTNVSVTSWSQNMVNQLTRYLLKKNICGNNVAERILASAGIKGNTDYRKPYMIKSNRNSVYANDVVSTADTMSQDGYGKNLGYNGGRMDDGNTGSVNLDSNDFGMLICINSTMPEYFYAQGLHREMMHINSTNDFWQKDFVNTGVQAIANVELFSNTTSQKYTIDRISYAFGRNWFNKIFGFTSKYSEYCAPKNVLAGDYCIPTLKTASDSWLPVRKILKDSTKLSPTTGDSVINPPFNGGYFSLVRGYGWQTTDQFSHDKAASSVQFDRIFVDTDSNYDHVNQYNIFDISVVRNVRGLGDYSIGDDSDGEAFESNYASVVND